MATRDVYQSSIGITWNPWHGCHKYSEGCENCYMYFLDKKYDKDGSDIYRTKSNFNLPLKKDKDKNYKIPSGETVHLCVTSDFFLEEADDWRNEIWDIIRQRPDLTFWIITKRAERVKDHLPDDWGDGYENVVLLFTTENQKRADERIPILLSIPAKEKMIMIAPFIGPVNIKKYLETGQISQVLADGENYEGARPLHYEWIKDLYDQCKDTNTPLAFLGTGNYFIKNGKTYSIPKAYQRTEAIRSGLQWPPVDTNIPIQKKCNSCLRNDTCNGCKWCGRCG